MAGPLRGAADTRPARRPAHAGTFYPADAGALGRLVDRQLKLAGEAAAAHDPLAGATPLGLLVPHAGLVYSGEVAAAAWRTLGGPVPGATERTVVLIGTNHYVGQLRGAAVWPAGPWLDPLGAVPVDEVLAAGIVALGPPFSADPEAHAQEHSLEVQLPFLARACPGTLLVPILAAFRSRAAGEAAGAALGRLIGTRRAEGRDVVLVVSSDLVHYPPARAAVEADRVLLEAVVALDGAELERRDAEVLRAGIPGLVCSLCGLDAVFFALAAVRAMGAREGVLLAAATSADVRFGDPLRTVGYGAVAFR